MPGVSERIAFLATSLYRDPVFRAHLQEINPSVKEQKIVFWAGVYALRSEYQEGVIDNFGTDPSIDEVCDAVIKISGEGEV